MYSLSYPELRSASLAAPRRSRMTSPNALAIFPRAASANGSAPEGTKLFEPSRASRNEWSSNLGQLAARKQRNNGSRNLKLRKMDQGFHRLESPVKVQFWCL